MSSRFLPIVLIISLALRAIAVAAMGDKNPSPDALDDYFPMAVNFLAGQGFVNAAGEPDCVRGPGYSLFIAAVYSLGASGSLKAILWAQALLDTLTTFLVAGMARRAIGPVAGMVAAFLYAINPLAIYACPIAGPEILFAFLLTAGVAAYMRGIESNLSSNRQYGFWLALAGLALGGAVLSRATPVLLVPVLGVWVLVVQLLRLGDGRVVNAATPSNADLKNTSSVRLRRGLLGAVILGASAASVVLPWTYRNWVVFHEFIPVVANGGVNFYSGSSERFWPGPPEHHRQRALRRDELIALGAIPVGDYPKTPGAGDKYQFAMGMANYRLAWKEDSLGLIAYLFRKSLRIWYATQSGRMERFVGAVNVSYLLLALAGLVTTLRLRRGDILIPCLITVAYFPLVLAGMFPLARYVVGFTPCLCVMSAAIVLLTRSKPRTTTLPQPSVDVGTHANSPVISV